jgi:hypothetical protein
VLREAVPEARQAEPPSRRNQPRRRQAGPAPLDEAGRKAVQQAVSNQGAGPIQTGIARGAARKAVEGIGGKFMMGRDLPGIFGAAFAPMGGADKPMRVAAKTANAINQDAGTPDRADGRDSATAIERAIQAAGPEKFMARLEDDPGFGFGTSSGGFNALQDDEDREQTGGFGVGLLDS